MPGNRPSAEAVGEALERVLGSDIFARSERARTLLRHLVEREQAGRGGDLKGFSIAMDVFGRDAEFDPSTDAVVRVQAGRLRDLLKAYYAGAGRSDRVRIEIPRGGYAPIYHGCEEVRADEAAILPVIEPDADDADKPVYARLVRHMRMVTGAVAVIAAILGYVVYTTIAADWPDTSLTVASNRAIRVETASADGAFTPEMRPSVALETAGEQGAMASVASSLRIGLAGFDTIDFIASGQGRAGASFVFSVMAGGGPAEALVELRASPEGKVLLSRAIHLGQGPDVTDLVAELLTTTIPTSGVLYAHIRANGLESPLTRCLMQSDAYYADQTTERHRRAYECLEELVRRDSRSTLAHSELAALHLEAVTDGHGYPPNASTEKALGHARRAVALAPTSPYAHRATGFLLSRLGGGDESIRWMQKAYELNRYDLSMAAAYAYALIKAGRYAEGTPIMRRAVAVSSARPSWWDYALFLGAFMQGEMDSAAAATGALAITSRSHYLAARLIAARHGGHGKEADALIEEISRDFPKFAIDPRAHFEDAKYADDLTDRLVDELIAAGLGGQG